MQGPNLVSTKRLIEETQMQIIASGGVSSLQDLRDLRQIDCAGAILGRAMYEGAFTLEEAFRENREA